MAVEQARGDPVDGRADVYGLGATLYDLLSGEPPFSGPTVYSVIAKILREEPLALRRRDPGIPADLETIVAKCLEKDRERRYGTALDFADDLSRWLAGEATAARPPGAVEHAGRWLSRRRAVVVAASVPLTVAGVLGCRAGWPSASMPRSRRRPVPWPRRTPRPQRRLPSRLKAPSGIPRPVLCPCEDSPADKSPVRNPIVARGGVTRHDAALPIA